MSDEDQERFEDYLELENYIKGLQTGKPVHPPENLTPEQVRIYQMAVLFSTATDENATPRPEFVEQLKAQLLEASEQPQESQPEPAHITNEHALAAEPTEPALEKREAPRTMPSFSRRGLLRGGYIAAASLAIGVGIGYETQKNQQAPTSTPPPSSSPGTADQQMNIPENVPTEWHYVTTLAELGNNAVRFTSNSIVGYILRKTNATDTTDNIIALVATCTHRGCLVQWKNTEHQFYCPCHGAIFDAQGKQKPTDYPYQLSPLSSLTTKIEQGKIYVEVPL